MALTNNERATTYAAVGVPITTLGGSQPLSADLDLGQYAVVSGNSQVIFSVKAYGAVGDGVADDTAAIAAAIAAMGEYTAVHPDYRAATVGGGVVYFPPGKYKVTSTLFYQSSMEIRGAGWSSQILFAPAAPDNLWEPNPVKAALNGHHDVTFAHLAMFGQNANAQDGIHWDQTRNTVNDSTYMKDFRGNANFYGYTLNTYSFYHTIINPQWENNGCNLYVEPTANAGSVSGGKLGGLIAGGGATPGDYLANIKAAGWSFNGTCIEGEPAVACVNDEGMTTFTGCYTESPNGKPFVRKDATAGDAIRGSGGFMGLAHQSASPLVLFHNFDQVAETSAYANTMADTWAIGTPQPIPLIVDGSFRHGYGALTLAVSVTHSAFHADTEKRFNSRGSMKYIHDGSGIATESYVSLSALDLSPYLGQRLYLTFNVYDPNGTFSVVGVGNPNKFAWFPVDYGNGWKLGVVDFAVTAARVASCNFSVHQLSAVAGAAAYITNIQAWVGGFPLITSERLVDPLRKYATAPQYGPWYVGDTVYHDAPAAGVTQGWVCTIAGRASGEAAASGAGTATLGSPIITAMADTSDFWVGDFVTGTAHVTGTVRVTSKTATTLTLSANATGNGATTINTQAAVFKAMAVLS